MLRALSLCTCCRRYPGAADGRSPGCKITHPYQPSRIPLSGRPAHRPFRGLLGVYSRCGLHTRAVTKVVTAIRGLQTFRHLHACPGCFRLERSPGGVCTAGKAPPCHGARGNASLPICPAGEVHSSKAGIYGLKRPTPDTAPISVLPLVPNLVSGGRITETEMDELLNRTGTSPQNLALRALDLAGVLDLELHANAVGIV